MDLHYLTLLDVSRLIAARKLSPVEVTEAILRRIECLDRTLKSFVQITGDLAIDQARDEEAAIMR